MQNHDVSSTKMGCGSIGIFKRMGGVRFAIFFGLPSAFLKPTEVTGVAVSLADSAPFVFVPNAVTPTCKTSPLSPALWSMRTPWRSTSTR